MFRREVDGVSYHFEVAGLWGSGNVVTERELMASGENTIYTMWTGEGLTGPRTGEYIDKYPALWGTTSLGEFVDRYGWLGDECKVFLGDQVVSAECEAACGHVGDICGADPEQSCLDMCSRLTDDDLSCLAGAQVCDDARDCL